MTVAVDTDFLLLLADADDEAWHLYTSLLEHEQPFAFVALPAIVDWLEFSSRQNKGNTSDLALRAWRALNSEWKIKTVGFNESQRKPTWVVGYHLRQTKLLGEALRVESEVIAESILAADVLLASAESPLHKLDQQRLALETKMLGLSPLAIFTPSAFAKAILH